MPQPQLQCVIITPEKKVVDTRASFVVIPLTDGELGVAPRRAAMIGRLGAGAIRVTRNDGIASYYVEGGFAEVLNNVVTVLTNRAISVDKLLVMDIEQELTTAMAMPTDTDDAVRAREQAIQRARMRMRLADNRSSESR